MCDLCAIYHGLLSCLCFLCVFPPLPTTVTRFKPKAKHFSLSGRQVFDGLQDTDSSTTVVLDGPALAADVCGPAGCCQQRVFVGSSSAHETPDLMSGLPARLRTEDYVLF